jgi:hypothetical protein
VKIALFGHFMYQLAVGLRALPGVEVMLFLDSRTIPHCLKDQEFLDDTDFVHIEPWVTWQGIVFPNSTKLSSVFKNFDVALVTDLGPIFARSAGIPYFIIPSGTDVTQLPFPFRSWSARPRGPRDLLGFVIAVRMRKALRSANDVWPSGPFSPWLLAAKRLGMSFDTFLPQAIDTELFSPVYRTPANDPTSNRLTIFHPNRILFSRRRCLVESGGSMMNDLLFEGFARAVGRGVDAWLVLIERESSWEQEEARRILAELGVGNRVSWLEPDDRAGFTWTEMPKQYNASDIVVSGFAGWTALVSLEGAACGKPVITNLEPHAMEAISSEGNPFVQASTIEEIEEAIVMLAAPLQRESIGQASRKWMIDNYDRERVAQRCLALLVANGFDT